MKKLFMILEDIWVTAAFAEAGAYDALMSINNPRLRYRKIALLRSVRSC
jgi:hypothetical protein